MARTIVITGANSGIGYATAEALAGGGDTLALACRNEAKAQEAMRRIRQKHPQADLRFFALDLASLASVRACAAALLEALPRIDVLVNNAGVYRPRRELTVDGLEATLQINHFGPFLLTSLLAHRLLASAPARIVNVASAAHRNGKLAFDDPMFERRYDGMAAYGTSKLMNILHARALARRLPPTEVTANSLHPGVVATSFAKDRPSLFGLLARLLAPLLLKPDDGAATTLHVVDHPEGGTTSGVYFDRCRPARPRSFAEDDRAAERLWSESERLTGAPSWPEGAPPPHPPFG